MKRYFLSFPLFLIASFAEAQGPVGSWQDHLSYNTALTIAAGLKEIYASTGSSLMIYNKEYNELRKASRVQGLSETGISTIAWSAETNSLIIAYQSTNVDIMTNQTIYNIPDIKRKYIPGNKEIFRIRTKGNYAYLTGSIGIVVIDLMKKEIYDTWKPGSESTEIYDIAFDESNVYAATSSGLFYAPVSTPGLSYYGNWNKVNTFPNPTAVFNSVIYTNNHIFVNSHSGPPDPDIIFVLTNPQEAEVFSTEQYLNNLSLDTFSDGFTVTSASKVRIYNTAGILTNTIDSYNQGKPDMAHAVADGNDIWIADKSIGLVRMENMRDFVKLSLPGPSSNNVIYISASNGKAYVSGGGTDNAWNNLMRPFQVFVYENNNWVSLMPPGIYDPMRVLPDPADNNHFWVSTWGAGILEYKNNILIKKYDDSNSPLQTIIPGKPYSRICGLAMDRDRNLWITQTGVPGSVKVLKSDNTWITFPFTIDAPTIGDIIVTSTGQKWIVLPRGYGLFIFDDNNTPENSNDDRYRQMLVKDTDNKVISLVYSIAEDLDGNIWVGTDQGPVIYSNTSGIFNEEPKAFRIKVPRNDGSGLADYMLGTEIITSIAVDGANRKWLGTFNSGAYLLSADGTEKIINYNEENSPLLSNTVISVAVDGKTGVVWLGTAKGVISVRGDATKGAERFSKVYAFPNPVRETYTGNLTITGLMRNSSVRITDISGNLVYRCTSDGGQATWNLLNYRGERVSTGVYLIFVANEDGTEAMATKVLVIK
ncbi:MAG: T9SS type A sorting domain-containing protein [Bacteroidales bacterium]|nr:T9SS type A sorting domain-containing protein [Bacteroidales bacterium]